LPVFDAASWGATTMARGSCGSHAGRSDAAHEGSGIQLALETGVVRVSRAFRYQPFAERHRGAITCVITLMIWSSGAVRFVPRPTARPARPATYAVGPRTCPAGDVTALITGEPASIRTARSGSDPCLLLASPPDESWLSRPPQH